MQITRRIFRVEKSQIHYLRTTIESYDGMALVRTVDPHTAHIEVLIAPGCEELVQALAESLAVREGLQMKPCSDGFSCKKSSRGL